MKIIGPISTCLLIMLTLVSCTKQNYDPSPDVVGTHITVSLTTKGSGQEAPVSVNTIRLVCFDAEGQCIGNEIFDNSEITTTENNGIVTASMNPGFSLPGNAKAFSIYAVANEAGMFSNIADGDASLSKMLDDISTGSYSMDLFLDLMDSDYVWDESEASVSATSPNLLLFFKSENVSIPTNQTGNLNINISQSNATEPTMAIVEIEKITSEAINGLSYPRLSDAAKVFVLDARLEGIPATYTATKGGNGEKKDISLLTRNIEGYCDREWKDKNGVEGTISQTTTGNLTQIDRVDKRFYRVIAGSQGAGCWDMVPHSQAYSYSTTNNKDRYTANNGNIRDFINLYLTPLFTHPTSYTSDPLDKSALKNGVPTPSATPWTIAVNKKYYVSENISDDPSEATAIVVKLAIATPTLDNSALSDNDWSGMASWNNPEFTSDGYPISNYTSNVDDFFKTLSHFCWADDPEMIDVQQNGKMYKYFVGNFARERIGAINRTFKTGDAKIKTEWKDISTSTHIIEVRIPVNNARFDSDYSVRRGIRYKVNLFVDGSTYDKLMNSTPTKASDNFSDFVHAEVTAVKMN